MSFIRKHPLISAAAAVATVPVGVFSYFWAYGMKANSPAERKERPLPGDELLREDDPKIRLQEEIEIDATPEEVWPVLAQLGQRKGGFYALSWLERLCTFHIYNTFEKFDEWQKVEPGEFMFYHQSGIGSEIKEVVPGKHLTSVSDSREPTKAQGGGALLPPFGIDHFAWTWNFILEELPGGRTRFTARTDATWQPWDKPIPKWLNIILLGSPSVFMVRQMLEKVKQVAEGRQSEQLVDRLVRTMVVRDPESIPELLGKRR